MRTKYFYLVTLWLLASCAKDTLLSISPTENRQAYGTEAAVKAYLSRAADHLILADSNAITNVAGAIAFSSKKEILSEDKRQVTAVAYDLASVGEFLSPTQSASIVFFLQDGVVRTANIVAFSRRSANDKDIAIAMLTDVFNPTGYTGVASVYSVAGKLMLRNEIVNGKLIKHSIAMPRFSKKPPKVPAKTSQTTTSCTDWYLVTRVNGTVVGSEYLYSVCDCDGTTTRPAAANTNAINRTSSNCGGGGGGGGEPGVGGNPPANPTEGQTFFFREQDGTTKKYVAENGTWILKMVLLPEATIYGNPAAHPQFVSDSPPEPLQQIMGNDGYLYVYSPWSGAWAGIPSQMEYIDPAFADSNPPDPPDVTAYDCGQLRNHHSDDPIQHGQVGTLQDLVNQSAGQTRSQVISQRGFDRIMPLVNLPLGPNVRYIYDPLNPDIVIDLRHMLGVGYYGQGFGNTLEATQYIGGQDSAFDHQDYFSNQLGYDFYRIYGSSFASQPSTFISLLQQFLTGTASQLGTPHRTRNTSPVLINQRCP